MSFYNNNINSNSFYSNSISGITNIFSGTTVLSNVLITSANSVGNGISIVNNLGKNIVLDSLSGVSPHISMYTNNNISFVSGTTQVKIKQNNTTFTNAGINDPELIFYTNPGEVWAFECHLIVDCTGTSGIRAAVSGTPGFNIFYNVICGLSTVNNFLGSAGVSNINNATGTFCTAANLALPFHLNGVITPTASTVNNVQMRYACVGAGQTGRVYKGSYLYAKRII